MKWTHWSALLAVNVLASVCYIGIRVGLQYAPPLVFGGLRALTAGVVLLVLATLMRAPVRPARRDWLPVTVLAILATTVTYGAMFASPAQMGAGLASVLGNIQPLLLVVLGIAFLGEPITRGKVVALTAGLTGVGFILYPSMMAAGGSGRTVTGSLLALGASLGIATGSIFVKRMRARPGLLALTGWQSLIGSLPLLALGSAQLGATDVRWTPTFTAVLLFLALLGTALPTTLWFWLLQRHDVGRLSMFLFLTPVLGLALASVVFGERFGMLELAGVLVTLFGLLVVSAEMSRATTSANTGSPRRERLLENTPAIEE